MRRETKATGITPEVKKIVWERDNGLCIRCGKPGLPNAHFIPRSHGGLGIPENILTLCPECHRRFDQTAERKALRNHFRNYLESHYPDWDESKLIYKK